MFSFDLNFISHKLLHSDMQVCMKRGGFINNISDQYELIPFLSRYQYISNYIDICFLNRSKYLNQTYLTHYSTLSYNSHTNKKSIQRHFHLNILTSRFHRFPI